MKVLILGSNGYLGNPLMCHLEKQGHTVKGVDNDLRKRLVKIEANSDSLTEVVPHKKTMNMDICSFYDLDKIISSYLPDVIIHLAEQPSAPYSMKNPFCSSETQVNNIKGTLNLLWSVKKNKPDTHIIKLGTAGEYPDWLYEGIKVPESPRIKVDYQNKEWEIPTPRYAGSFYHFSKLYDSYNIDYACKIWGLNVTDINQGIVYGHIDGTRFDYDQYFGTVVNRMCVQSIAGIPLTVYGTGEQTRGFININNVMEAITLVIEKGGNGYDIIHQLTEAKSIISIAKKIQEITKCDIQYLNNPRSEMKKNFLSFEAKKLTDMGLKKRSFHEELLKIFDIINKNKNKINHKAIMPTTTW